MYCRRTKRGQVESLLKWFFRFGIVAIIGVFIIIVANAYLQEDFSALHAEEARIVSAIVREECLASREMVQNTKVLDPGKITDGALAVCYRKESLGYEVTLRTTSGLALATGKVLTQEQSAELSMCGISKLSFYKCSLRKEYVLYAKEGKIVPGVLEVRVVNRVY